MADAYSEGYGTPDEPAVEAPRGSNILAWTVSYGDRPFLPDTVRTMRASAGCWFDWSVYLGRPAPELYEAAELLVRDPERLGVQFLQAWPENRGQHFAFSEALELARARGYKWLLRLDDDVKPKTKRWLKKMVEQLDELKERTGDEFYRLIAAPRIIGLKNPLAPVGSIDKGQTFAAEVMDTLGGACRLHPVELLAEFQPDRYAPTGRGDPEGISYYLERKAPMAMLIRLNGIRVLHDTAKLEAQDSPETAAMRRMSKYWPYLGPGN